MKNKFLPLSLLLVGLTACAGFGEVEMSEADAQTKMEAISKKTADVDAFHFSMNTNNPDGTKNNQTITIKTVKQSGGSSTREFVHYQSTSVDEDYNLKSYLDWYEFKDEEKGDVIWFKTGSANAQAACYSKLTSENSYNAANLAYGMGYLSISLNFALYSMPDSLMQSIKADYTTDKGYETKITYINQIIGGRFVIRMEINYTASELQHASFKHQTAELKYQDNALEAGSYSITSVDDKITSTSFSAKIKDLDLSKPSGWKNIVQ